MKNLEIAQIFEEIADILEIKNVEWKPQAYRKAARALKTCEDVEAIYKKGGIKALDKIPGVGQRLAKKIVQYIETGKISEYERLKKTVPKYLTELMKVPGLGPKKAAKLANKLKIKSMKNLEQVIKQHKIAKLKTFGEKSEENIAKGIALMKKSKKRVLLGVALPIAEEIIARLRVVKGVDKVIAAGSLRRMLETIGDIDILITSTKPELVMDKFTSMKDVARVLAKGPTRGSILLKNNLQVDVRVIPPDEFGSALQYFTGSKNHSIALRKLAIKKGLKISEYGVFKGKKKIAGKTEKAVYKAVNLPYIEPELRENNGEIEVARQGKLPKLLGYSDIKGDLHVHSKYSDGNDAIETITKVAKKIGYGYIAITDHSPSLKIAHGLDEKQLKKKQAEIKKINKKNMGIKVLHGTEVDILPDGSLDYSDKILKQFDIVIAAVHSHFKMTEAEMTKRIIKALENKYVNVLAHPTGRVINKRDAYKVNLEKIFSSAKKNKVALEVDGTPDRLDLNDVHIREAIKAGVKLVCVTDAHSINNLKNMRLAIGTARRGWAQKTNILNTKSWEEIKKWFKK